jgi:hypothetical protein
MSAFDEAAKRETKKKGNRNEYGEEGMDYILPVAVSTNDRLCGLVVRAPGYRTEMYCASCEIRTEFIYVM